MLKNVQIHFADRVPEPTLYEVVEKLALLKPNLVFVHDKDMIHHNSNRPLHRSYNESLDAGKSYACKFKVMDNGVVAGYLFIGQHYSRRAGAKNWRIGVTSHLIQNGRGTRNTTYSSDVAKAVSNAKKFLSAKSMGRTMYEAYDEAFAVARDVTHRLMTPVGRGNFLTSAADAQILLHAYMTNSEISVSAIDSAMRDKLLTPAFEKALSEYYLARLFINMTGHNGTVFIQRMDAGYAFFTDVIPNSIDEADKAPVTIMDYEQLPVATQEKIGVLQLMENRELVKDMGIRVNDDSFFLM